MGCSPAAPLSGAPLLPKELEMHISDCIVGSRHECRAQLILEALYVVVYLQGL